MRTLAGGVLGLLIAAGSAESQGRDSVIVRRAGPGGSGASVLREVIAKPHDLVRSDTGTVDIAAADTRSRTLLIIAPAATVADTVHGDVVLVGGDLFVHPGAVIDGRAIAIGGGVYPSSLARIGGGTQAFRDGSFRATRIGSLIALEYEPLLVTPKPRLVSLPVVYGFRLPTYDRIDGLSVPFGPYVTPSRALNIDPNVTYRSNLGAFDPQVRVLFDATPRTHVRLYGERTTITNERWIRGDIPNSVASLLGGTDARNYYRARRIGADVTLVRGEDPTNLELFAGAQVERSEGVGPHAILDASGNLTGVTPFGTPWSLRRRTSFEGMRRPNPDVGSHRIGSGFGGARLTYSAPELQADADWKLEVPWTSEFIGASQQSFVQSTLDAGVRFPTFGTQRLNLRTHWLLTAGDAPAPMPRWSYIGGVGTLPTFDLLQFGGDDLFYLDSRYEIPFERILLPYLGSPTVVLRHALGAAGVGKLPALEQNLAIRLELSFVKAEFALDPRTHKHDLDIGLSISR